MTEPANRLEVREPGQSEPPATLVLTKGEVMQSVDRLCTLARNYAGLLETLSSGDNSRESTLGRFQSDRKWLQEQGFPETHTSLTLAFARHLLRKMTREPLQFSLPGRIGEFAARENAELLEYSNRLRKHSEPIGAKLAVVADLADELAAQGKDTQSALLSGVHSLFKAFLRQDWGDAELLLAHINLTTSTRERHELVRQIAKIARDIYNSLNTFSDEIAVEGLTSSTQEIPDAVARLRSVIEHLEQSANANLDGLERLSVENQDNLNWVREAEEVAASCQSEYERLQRDHPELAGPMGQASAAMRDRIMPRLTALREGYEASQNTILAMIANQSFQDLTGQTLEKVIQLVKSLQFQLVELLQRYTGSHPAEKPSEQSGAAAAEARPEGAVSVLGPPAAEKQSQENVDKLLTELGF